MTDKRSGEKRSRPDNRRFVERLSRALQTAFPLALLVIVVLASADAPRAQSTGEYSVKAAFLYNFAKYVDWPGDDSGPIVVGVLGDDPFGGDLDRVVAGKAVNGRQIAVKRLRWGQDLRQCQILFVSSSESQRMTQILGSLRGANVLTVGETDQFDHEGGIVKFLLEENRVRFEINIDAAEQAGLKLSSKLLAVAKVVRGQ